MKTVAISSLDDVAKKLEICQLLGYTTFIYHHADPKHELLNDKFMYIHDDAELKEKLHLLKSDVSVQDLIRM